MNAMTQAAYAPVGSELVTERSDANLAHLPVTAQAPASTPLAIQSPTPAMLLQMAVQQGADLDKLERLMALQERWEAAQAKKAYDQAFAEFKAESIRIIKNRNVSAGPLNGKKYAELFAIVNAITPALSRANLSSAWKLTKDEKDWLEVTCTLRHIGGHEESVAMGGPPDQGGAKNAIQARASTVSYLERYTLKAITGLSEQEDDDDGNGLAPASLRETWVGRAALAASTSELTRVSKDGVKEFNKAKDRDGYTAFVAAVQVRGATLREMEASHV